MPEGLDQAADAFASAINPRAAEAQPRDPGGRFAAKPEPMFETRPIEGDPITGDTRDGGEDARLAAAERRIADGRAEEGDEQSLQNRARPRNARGDAGHNDNTRAANDNALERTRPQEPADQHAEGTDLEPAATAAEGDAEGDAEQDPGPKYEVVVDGQTTEVSLAEALRGYIKHATYQARMAKVDQARQAVEAEWANVGQARAYYVQKLQLIERTLAELTPQPPNWDQEFAVDPRAAHEKLKAYQAIYGKIAWAQAEQQRSAQEAQADYDRTTRQYAIEQFSQFVAEAKIRDEDALGAEIGRMRAYARTRGFSEPEIATVYDKRMLAVLRDAARHHESTLLTPKPVPPGQGRALIPGSATPIGNAGRRHIDDAQRKLAQSGRLDDAAALFERLIR
jgi:hypothetical protein